MPILINSAPHIALTCPAYLVGLIGAMFLCHTARAIGGLCTLRRSMTDSQNFFWYYAFGSNLLADRIRYRQKGAEYECNGKLDGYRLEFANYYERWKGALATIVKDDDSHVYGCVWRMPNEYSDSLDEQEKGYHRLMVPIQTEKGIIECRTYQYSDLEAETSQPSPHYKLVIVEGAKERKLPADYIERLENIPDNGYVGPVDVDIPLLEKLNKQQPN